VTAEPVAPSVAGSVALLERAIGYTRGSLALVTPERLSRPTPCADWDLAALLAHMNDSMLALHDAVVGQRVAMRPALERPGFAEAAVDALCAHACSLLGAWSRLEIDAPVAIGGHSLPSRLVALTGALEITVHGWDVSVACDGNRPIPPALAAELLFDPADRGLRFKEVVEVPYTAPLGERLLAFTGRDPLR
jgi:uncharacterized protein (TIGR03086 family)